MNNGQTSSQENDGSADHCCDLTISWKKVDINSSYPPRDGHCACSCNGTAYVFGGVVQSGGDSEHRETNDLLTFDTENLVWKKINSTGNNPLPRVSATMAAINNKLYLFGGLSNNKGWLNDFYVFNTDTKVWSKPEVTGAAPSPRDKLSSAVCGSRIYFFGGFGPKLSRGNVDEEEDENDGDDDDDEVNAVKAQQKAAQFGWFDDIFVFDTVTSTWSQPMHMNSCTLTPRAAHTMCAVGDQLVIFGGRDCDSRVNDLHFYDTASRKWTAGPTTPRQLEPRSFHAACTVGSKIIICGGRGTQDQHFNDVHIFDFDNKRWLHPKSSGDAVSPRGSHCLVAVGTTVVLYGGSSDFNRNIGHCTKYHNDTFVMQA